MNDPTKRPNVVKFLPHWQEFLAKHGRVKTKRYLTTGQYKFLNKKDAYGLLCALGLNGGEPKDGRVTF